MDCVAVFKTQNTVEQQCIAGVILGHVQSGHVLGQIGIVPSPKNTLISCVKHSLIF